MTMNRRDALMSMMFGSGMVGLRALATGLPASFLLNPHKALADMGAAPACTAPQYVIFNTSTNGDPLSCNVPGTYEDPAIVHSTDPAMAPTTLTLQGAAHTAAAPWATLPQQVLDRTCFFHVMTNTPVHPKEPQVLGLMGGTTGNEMFPSIMAKQMAPCLQTLQAQPLSVGASSPNETITFNGAPLPSLPPSSLKATLTNAPGGVTNLQKLRDDSLNAMYGIYRNKASAAQKAYLDSIITSQQQVRGIRQDLLNQLESITDNSPASQMTAAIALIQMGVSPVIGVHIPFGGDNHGDPNLKTETLETVAGVGTLVALMAQLATAGLADKVTFLSLNVFGRTLGPGNDQGRSHNPNHQVSIAIGKGFRGGVLGGITKVQSDYGALPIQSKTGVGDPGGDISAINTLASFGKTALTAIGVDAKTVEAQIPVGSVITAALAT